MTLASAALTGGRVAVRAVVPYAYALIVFGLIAGFVLISGGGGLSGWMGWGATPALFGMVVATGPAGRRSRSRRSGSRSWVAHESPRIIREPESGWWEAHPEPEPTAMTVAVVGESETSWDAAAVVARLAELAVRDELLVVYGSEQRSGPGHQAVVAGLRDLLPRHQVIAVRVGPDGLAFHIGQAGAGPGAAGLGRQDAALLDRFLENGSLPVVITPASAIHDVTAELSSRLRADRVLRVCRTSDGIDLHQVWRRHATASAN